MEFLSNELIFNVLLNLDINALTIYFGTHKEAQSICNDSYFWKQKFQHDHLPLYENQNECNLWINQYKNTINSYKLAQGLVDLIKMEHDEYPNENIEVNFDLPSIKVVNTYIILPSQLKDTIISDNVEKYIKDTDKVWLSFTFYERCEQEECEKYHNNIQFQVIRNDEIIYDPWIESSIDEIERIWCKIFYFYPNIKVFDKYYRSYLPDQELIDLVNYGLISGKISMDEYFLLDDRLNFWKHTL
jgi:hypothetical protein